MSLLSESLRHWFSPEQLARLRAARVGIAGAGGLGSNAAMALVRSGIRNLVVVDGDFVEPTNLNRQAYWPEDVGKPKVVALEERLRALEHGLIFEGRREWLTEANACAVFRGCDAVIEALDGAAFKAELCGLLLEAGFFVVGASGLAGFGLPPLGVRRMGERFVCVGDFATEASQDAPTLAPRVIQAAAMQADAVLSYIIAR